MEEEDNLSDYSLELEDDIPQQEVVPQVKKAVKSVKRAVKKAMSEKQLENLRKGR